MGIEAKNLSYSDYANWSGTNEVSVTRFTTEQFYSYFQTLQHVQDPR